MGSDAWGSAELMTLCGNDCKGLFFCTHYAAAGAKGATKEFIDRYKAKYGYVPDDVAALTWDATRIVLQADPEDQGADRQAAARTARRSARPWPRSRTSTASPAR